MALSKMPMMSMQVNDTGDELKMKRVSLGERGVIEDRLSNLPECILLHILSFMSTKDAVQTCILSKRWLDLWKRLQTLILNSSDFRLRRLFNKFVSRILSCRDGSVALQNLDCNYLGSVQPQLLKRLIRYAVSHNVQQLNLNVSYNLVLPPCIFSCQSLTSVKISVCLSNQCGILPKSLNFQAVVSLHLENLLFSGTENDHDQAEPFSTCRKLKTLVIVSCYMVDAKTLSISNHNLTNLTISLLSICNVKKPYDVVLSTPNLTSFAFKGVPIHPWSGNNLSFLEVVNVDAEVCECPVIVKRRAAENIISLLQMLTCLKLITFSSSTLQILSVAPDLLRALPCFGNLNSVKVKVKASSPIPDGVMDYFLQDSQSAKVTIKFV